MKQLEQLCKDLKKDFTPKIKDPKKPVSFWSEKDVLNNEIVDAFVIIFRTKGCSWAKKTGCSMCGYFNDSQWENVSDEDILTQFKTAMNSYSNQRFVKIFTSGSFFDTEEISHTVRKEVLSNLYETAEKVSVESRPEFILNNELQKISSISKGKIFEIGVGLETADNIIREKCINKGFTFNDYKKAADLLKQNKMKLKTYVLIKPPFLTEKESIDDAIKTIGKIGDLTDTISFNPTNIQKNTVVNYFWRKNMYRPPWLFSIVEILKNAKKTTDNVLVKCDIVAGGTPRGAHNCKKCDNNFLKAISRFSLTQHIEEFEDLDCNCREKWLDQLDMENLGFGSLANMYG